VKIAVSNTTAAVAGNRSSRRTCRMCVTSKQDSGEFIVASEKSGTARCPFERTHNSTTHYAGTSHPSTTLFLHSVSLFDYFTLLQYLTQTLNSADFSRFHRGTSTVTSLYQTECSLCLRHWRRTSSDSSATVETSLDLAHDTDTPSTVSCTINKIYSCPIASG